MNLGCVLFLSAIFLLADHATLVRSQQLCSQHQPFITGDETSFFNNVGPISIRNGHVQGIKDGRVIGNVHRIVSHPIDANITYIATEDGGIYKTENALSQSINWTQIAHGFEEWHVRALDFDYLDESYQTIVASVGYLESGSLINSIVYTKDGGSTWESTETSLYEHHVVGVAKYGKSFVACSRGVLRHGEFTRGGVFVSEDGGKSFNRVNGGRCNDVVSGGKSAFIATLDDGIYEYEYTKGLNRISPKNLMEGHTESLNVKLSYRKYKDEATLYAGYLNETVQALWRASNKGKDTWTWTEVDEPSTSEDGQVYGLHPARLGHLYFSILADIKSPHIVYLGGDYQPSAKDGKWPNSIGAMGHFGRLFKIDLENAVSAPITNSNTESNTAPPAFSRHLSMNPLGDLLEADKGGIYKRISPQKTGAGDWVSLNTNISIANSLQSQYLGSGFYIMSSEDMGIVHGTKNSTWTTLFNTTGSILKGLNKANDTTVYVAQPYMKGLEQLKFSVSSGKPVLKSTVKKGLKIVDSDKTIPDFIDLRHTPIYLNQLSSSNLIVGETTGNLFESVDNGETFKRLSVPGSDNNEPVVSLIYGSRMNTTEHISFSVLLGTENLYARISEDGPFERITSYPPLGVEGDARSLSVNPRNISHIAVLFGSGIVAETKNGGLTWKVIKTVEVSGKCFDNSEIQIIPEEDDSKYNIIISGARGVFIYRESKNIWYRFGLWSFSKVNHLNYDFKNDLLWVDTQGSGVWEIANVSTTITQKHYSVLPAPPPTPNYKVLTWVFAALTTLLILAVLILLVAFFRTRQKAYDLINE